GNVQKSAMSTKQPTYFEPAEHRPRHRNSEHTTNCHGVPKQSRAGIIRGPVKKEQVTERAP
ncbi:hypothetical protein GE21DRAFT_1218395, partial [Neurospora crassa]